MPAPLNRSLVITRGILKVTTFCAHVRTHAIPETQVGQFDSELRSFANLNAPERVGAPALEALPRQRDGEEDTKNHPWLGRPRAGARATRRGCEHTHG